MGRMPIIRPPRLVRARTEHLADREDLRYGPDLVADVLASDAGHEFASHSFSHVLFGRAETDRELADAELERSRELAADWDQSIDSFVYPRNDVGHRDVLADHSVTAYRGRSPTRDGVRGVFDSTVRDRSMLVEPTIDEYGLVNVPASMFLFGFEGPARTVAESIWRTRWSPWLAAESTRRHALTGSFTCGSIRTT